MKKEDRLKAANRKAFLEREQRKKEAQRKKKAGKGGGKKSGAKKKTDERKRRRAEPRGEREEFFLADPYGPGDGDHQQNQPRQHRDKRRGESPHGFYGPGSGQDLERGHDEGYEHRRGREDGHHDHHHPHHPQRVDGDYRYEERNRHVERERDYYFGGGNDYDHGGHYYDMGGDDDRMGDYHYDRGGYHYGEGSFRGGVNYRDPRDRAYIPEEFRHRLHHLDLRLFAEFVGADYNQLQESEYEENDRNYSRRQKRRDPPKQSRKGTRKESGRDSQATGRSTPVKPRHPAARKKKQREEDEFMSWEEREMVVRKLKHTRKTWAREIALSYVLR